MSSAIIETATSPFSSIWTSSICNGAEYMHFGNPGFRAGWADNRMSKGPLLCSNSADAKSMPAFWTGMTRYFHVRPYGYVPTISARAYCFASRRGVRPRHPMPARPGACWPTPPACRAAPGLRRRLRMYQRRREQDTMGTASSRSAAPASPHGW